MHYPHRPATYQDTLRAGHLYTPKMIDDNGEWLMSDVHGYVPQRIWWAPWRWRVIEVRRRSYDEVIATNLSRDGVIGMLKILNAWRGE